MTDESRLSALEGKVQELEAMVSLALRLLSLEKPVSTLLERYGASESEIMAVHQLLGDLAARAEKGGMYTTSFPAFESDLYAQFPRIRGNQEFMTLLLETLSVDRPVYREIHAYAVSQHWPGLK